MLHPQAHIFLAAADCGSFTKAASLLFISPPAVMKQINQFEQRLGVTLFDRTSHGITLTADGKTVYNDVKFIADYELQAKARLQRLSEKPAYVIRVGTSYLNPCKPLLDLWSTVSDDHPQFKIKIIPFEDDRSSIIATISSLGSSLDFIVGPCNSNEWLRRCSFFQLGEYKFCCALPRRHPLTAQTAVSLTDLHGECLMMIKPGDSLENDRLRQTIKKEHPQIRIENVPYFYDMEIFNHCEQSGNILLTLDGWTDIHPMLTTRPLIWDGAIPFGLLYAKNPTPDVSLFLQAATKSIAAN